VERFGATNRFSQPYDSESPNYLVLKWNMEIVQKIAPNGLINPTSFQVSKHGQWRWMWPNAMWPIPSRHHGFMATHHPQMGASTPHPGGGPVRRCCNSYVLMWAAAKIEVFLESSLRDILMIFWKLSWGLENDNTLFKNWWLGAICQILTVAHVKKQGFNHLNIGISWGYHGLI